ncbi:MAG TPA: hypothetical protein VFN97_16085 [Actinospica sp.]|nr:hypothetical protein [Actinospica sp.]
MILNRRTRAAVTALAILGGTMAGGVAAAGPAAAVAVSGCPTDGAEVSWNFYDSSGHLAAIGYLEQDTNGSCAKLVAQGAYYGERKWMDVEINNGFGTTYIVDHGYYSYYAGPINGPGYPVCAEAYFKMDDSGGNQIVSYQTKIYCD